MKRILTATALTAVLTTSAFAATEAQTVQLQSYLPTLNVEAMTDEQVATAMNIIKGSDSRSVKLAKLRAMVEGTEYEPVPVMITADELERIKEYAPDVDLSTVTQAQVDSALVLISSGSDAETKAKVRAVLSDDPTPMGTANSATEGEMIILERYLPEGTVASLSEAELNTALSIVYAGGNPGDISAKLDALFN